MTEVRLGLGVLVVVASVAAWVAWRGAHPDPALFEIPHELLDPGRTARDRGPLPNGLAADGWREDRLATFGQDDLYVKIDGREDYYKSFGFERLWWLSIVEAGSDTTPRTASPPRIVDIELFDLGEAPNALGAYAGERPPEVVPSVDDAGMFHTSENALFLTRGRYYARAIGSDAGPEVRTLLAHLETRLRTMQGEPLPWGYALFVGALQIDPGRVSFMAENAFSFGFARNVYAARLQDGDTEIFVVAAASAEIAPALAQQFTAGFLNYGQRADAGTGEAVEWVQDRFQNQLSGAMAHGLWVVGVRGAPDIRTARVALATLVAGVDNLPEGVIRQAATAAVSPPDATPGEGDGEDYKEETSPTLESRRQTPEN